MSADVGTAAGELSEAQREKIEKEMGKIFANFHSLRLGDAGAFFVAEKLRGNTTVGELLLHNCGVSAVGLRALGKSLTEENATLKRLLLGGNKLRNDGADLIAQMLHKNSTLEVLALGFCGVGYRGACALGEALKENITLKFLHLGGNDIGDDTSDSLAEALRWNESLENLDLSFCDLTDIGAASLLSALRESNSSLKELDLDGNDAIKDATMGSIQDLLRENEAVLAASAERRARCLLFCCLQLAPTAHEHVVPSIGAVPVPVMQYAVEHAAELHVAKRFEVGVTAVRESSAGVRDRSTLLEDRVARSRRP